MKVLSLFDGISAGMVALKRAGFIVDEYHAFEIDKYAIQISEKNYPQIIRHGSVVGADFSQFENFDLLIGGSPCQGFSFAGKQLNFNDPRSALFFEFVRALKVCKPKYFLLENVKMKKEYQRVISDHLGVEPVEINSALVSAQNRKRLYWCNWNVEQPNDKGINLSDIIQDGVVDRDKAYCIDANYFKGASLKNYLEKCRRQVVFNYSSSGRGNSIVEDRTSEALKAATLTGSGYSNRSFSGVAIREKSQTILSTIYKENAKSMLKGKKLGLIVSDKDFFYIRKLTPVECERLQTLPDNYTDGVSDTQRYKMLGNGWTVDVIAHIFKGMKDAP